MNHPAFFAAKEALIKSWLMVVYKMDIIWSMTRIHITSVLPPFEEEQLYPRATRFLRRADAMGLLQEPIQELSATVVRRVARILSKRGLASDLGARLTVATSSDEFVRYLDAALLALDESPVPEAELAKLDAILGRELLIEMLDISVASLQRYQSGDRETPDAIAERAHFLTSIIAALEGTYNAFGVRRWFERPRSVFSGRTARQLLSRRWMPSDESARTVLAAAESLQHLGAT